MLTLFGQIVRRDVTAAWRRRSDIWMPAMFYVIATSLFAFGVGPDRELLRIIGPGVIWVAALLVTMIGLGRLFDADEVDGTLEQMLLSSEPLAVIALAKVTAHWSTSGLPLVMLSPLLAVQFDLPWPAVTILAASLLIGTPLLSLLGAIGAALTLNVRGGGMLIAVLVLPLFIPVLIFGAGAVDAAMTGSDASAHLFLLAGGLVAAMALAPWVVCAALRIALE